ncbi:hypothetical protein [Arthrobacter sp. A2-55]|uniref:hypothetical protein n=1 Tax=Arthrobacter sp. A2-55 TaxID=2897337 RepID=UPI0021CD7E20|nr:hypothetical protein [Arthrobacter sp. A2-55]MCU6480145.1 hypothetical protein [Arthrobacter sp. A2-55]
MNFFRRRMKDRPDRGSGLLEAIVGMALGAMILVGAGTFIASTSQTSAANSSIQTQSTAITQTMARMSQDVQFAGTILTAAPNELVIASKDGSTPIINRWVRSGTTFYRQIWQGAKGSYPFGSGAWIPVTSTGGAAPNTDGTQSTEISVKDLKADLVSVFSYYDADKNELKPTDASPLSALNGGTNAIRLVEFHLKSNTLRNGVAEGQTAASPRNYSAGGATGSSVGTPPVCPVVAFDSTDTSMPILRWSTVPGTTTYVITRNSVTAATVTVPAGNTVGTWTDTLNPGASGDVVMYSVLAKASDGTLSAGCRPALWRVKIDAPVWNASSVLPASPEAAGWTTAPDGTLSTPRIILSWNPVTGNNGYELYYRSVDPATGTATGSTYLPAPGYDGTSTTFTWDGGGWGQRYEWYIKTSSRSGQSSESVHIQTLTHPSAPGAVSVKAQYGTGATKDTQGDNVLSWNPVATATQYEVRRYNSGTTGASTSLGTTTALTFTDTVNYGTTYSYYVVARNNGPRGVDISGAPVTADRSSAAPESVAISKSAVVTQLQYPPVPAVVPASSTGSRDINGANIVQWGAAPSATGYHVGKYTPVTMKLTCLTGNCAAPSNGTTALTLSDPAPPASQSDYAVAAYNPTGMSVGYSANVRLTQRPAAPALNTVSAPTLSTDSASFATVMNGDSGNDSANKFCSTTTCSYELARGSTVLSTVGQQSGTTVPWNNVPNPAGSTITYFARSKNAALYNGGWSDKSSATVMTYPGAFATGFWSGDSSGRQAKRFNFDAVNLNSSGSSETIQQNGYSTLSWGASAGATKFSVKRVSVANDSTSTDSSLGLPPSTNISSATGSGSAGTWTLVAAPGATYRYEMSAFAANGLTRPQTSMASFTTPADLPQAGKIIIVCSGNYYTDQTTALYDHPEQLLGSRLIDFTSKPRRGAWNSISVTGLQRPKGQALQPQYTSTLGQGSTGVTLTSGAGLGYYYSAETGFDIMTVGQGGANSATLRITNDTYATFNSGCGPQGGTWGQMLEPTYPCYGYVPGTSCAAVNDQNRPQWSTK